MSILNETRFLERLTFFNGQRLFASDLEQMEFFQREIRQLHNVSLHESGVGSGYAVSGERGDRQVAIGPGYAIDDLGREIIHTMARHEAVPPVEGEDDGTPALYYLTVSYPADDDLEVSETRRGVCYPRGVVRRREEPVFCWVRLEKSENDELHPRDETLAAEIQSGRKILLARAEVQHCQLKKLSLAQRRNARPATQPHIVCGVEESPNWKMIDTRQFAISPRRPGSLVFVFLQATIDTAHARFLAKPCYSARIEGERQLNIGGRPVFAEGLVSITDPQKDRFTVQVMALIVSEGTLPTIGDDETLLDPLLKIWQVVWMGIE